MSSAGPGDAPALLFVYGSLLGSTGIARVDAALARCAPDIAGSVAGRLLDLGDYPGALPAAESAGGPRIKGRLLRLPAGDGGAALADLDRYEGFDPAAPTAGEFLRARARVRPEGGGPDLEAHVYWYNLPPAGRPEVPDGDWAAFRARRSQEKHP